MVPGMVPGLVPVVPAVPSIPGPGIYEYCGTGSATLDNTVLALPD